MSAHTPAPWPVERTSDGKRYLIGKGLVEGPNGYDVAEVYSDDCDPEEARANAFVLGAAPVLLKALKELLRDMEEATAGGMAWIDHSEVQVFKQRAKDAIALATPSSGRPANG